MGNPPRSSASKKSTWQDVGYYKDEYGRQQFGVIPSNIPERKINYNLPNHNWLDDSIRR